MNLSPAIFCSASLFTLALSLGAGCGRTELDDAEPCLPTDGPRACQAACGEGTQACIDGRWSACMDTTTTRSCTGVCGDGTQDCVGGRWEACVIPVATRPCASMCGPGVETCTNSQWGACDAPQPRPPTLHTTIRDFHASHPDFELPLTRDNIDLAIVADVLGPDDKPVYAGNPTTLTTSGAASFNQWYNDVPGQNMTTMIDLALTPVAGASDMFAYENASFFPIDGQLFGNEGRIHNYHFTLESHTHFVYRGGETFSFTGDDDVFVFINRRLVINLGGIHLPLFGSVSLDASASMLGITPGQTYQLDIFFAERHTVGSNFNVLTSIADVSTCE
jgi:fibro-slime domain-containing protein